MKMDFLSHAKQTRVRTVSLGRTTAITIHRLRLASQIYEPLLAVPRRSTITLHKSVFPYVPSDIVHIVITKHGGIKSGQVPRGVPVFGVTHCKGVNDGVGDLVKITDEDKIGWAKHNPWMAIAWGINLVNRREGKAINWFLMETKKSKNK